MLLVLGLLAMWTRTQYEYSRYRAQQERLSSRAGLYSTPWLGIDFRQNGQRAYMEYVDPYTTRVELSSGPFEFQLPRRGDDPGIGVVAWTDGSIHEAISGSMGISEVAYFAPGTGIADTEYGSGTLYLNNEAHNYFYGNRLHSTGQGRGAVAITSIWNGKDVHASDWRKPMYLVMFHDLDRDNIVDNGEYEKIVLEFTIRR